VIPGFVSGSIERTQIHPFNEGLLTEFLAPFSTAPRWPGQEVYLWLTMTRQIVLNILPFNPFFHQV